MNALKVVFLIFAIGLSSNFPVTPKSPNAYYPNTFKGGLITTQQKDIRVLGVEGKYEYYLQYLKFRLDYQKKPVMLFDRKSFEFPSCVVEETLVVC